MYIYVAILLAGLLSGGFTAYKIQDWRYAAKEKERLEAIDRDRRIAEKRIDTAAVGHERDKERIRTVTKTVEVEVERIIREAHFYAVDSALCFDPAGLQQLSIAAGSAQPASQPAPALPRRDSPD